MDRKILLFSENNGNGGWWFNGKPDYYNPHHEKCSYSCLNGRYERVDGRIREVGDFHSGTLWFPFNNHIPIRSSKMMVRRGV